MDSGNFQIFMWISTHLSIAICLVYEAEIEYIYKVLYKEVVGVINMVFLYMQSICVLCCQSKWLSSKSA